MRMLFAALLGIGLHQTVRPPVTHYPAVLSVRPESPELAELVFRLGIPFRT